MTDLGRGASQFKITEKYHETDMQLKAVGGKSLETSFIISSTSRKRPSEDDRFATCALLVTSICWEAVKNSGN